MNKSISFKFLTGTFLITYIMWGIILVANQIDFLEFGTPISRVLIVIGGNAPLIVAYIVLKQQKVITGIKQFAKEAFAIKQHYLHYVLLIAFLGLYFGVPAIMQGVSIGAKLYIGFLNIPLMIPLGGLEELGWRYVLQANLQKKFSFGVATSITACFWAVWHLPLFFIEGTANNFGLFTIMVFGMSFALATIYNVSKSIWLCILFHSMINALSLVWIIQDSIEIKIFTTVTMIILAFAITVYQKKKKGLDTANINFFLM